MKKVLIIFATLISSINIYSQNLSILAWTNSEEPLLSGYEQNILKSIAELDAVERIDSIVIQDDWEAMEISGFNNYDVVIIFEAGGSSASQFYGAIGYPKPLLIFEPYVLHKQGWEWYAQDEGFLSARNKDVNYYVPDRYTEVIENPDHPIFTGFKFEMHDEIVFSHGDDDLKNYNSSGDCYAIDLTIANKDIADAATPLASSRLARYEQSFQFTVNMWAIEENNTTPRIFLYALHASDLKTQNKEMARLVQNAIFWLDEGFDGIKNAADNGPHIYLNSPSSLIINGINQVSFIKIYNIAGELVLTNSGNSLVDVSGLKNGLYLVCVTDNSGHLYTAKILK